MLVRALILSLLSISLLILRLFRLYDFFLAEHVVSHVLHRLSYQLIVVDTLHHGSLQVFLDRSQLPNEFSPEHLEFTFSSLRFMTVVPTIYLTLSRLRPHLQAQCLIFEVSQCLAILELLKSLLHYLLHLLLLYQFHVQLILLLFYSSQSLCVLLQSAIQAILHLCTNDFIFPILEFVKQVGHAYAGNHSQRCYIDGTHQGKLLIDLIKPCMALLIILDTGCVARCLLHRCLTRG